MEINEKLAEEIHSDIEKSARETVKKLGKDWSREHHRGLHQHLHNDSNGRSKRKPQVSRKELEKMIKMSELLRYNVNTKCKSCGAI